METKLLAAKLRAYAVEMEKRGSVRHRWDDVPYDECYTCNLVSAIATLKQSHGYVLAFEFYSDGNQDELWSMNPSARKKVRATLLGFAAAMVETGDL